MGIFVLTDIYYKTISMKIKLTEAQYAVLEKHISEARQEKSPTSLKTLLGDNPTAQYLTIVQRMKGGSDDEYMFKLEEINGHKSIRDMNKGTKTKGCVTDLQTDTMIYGTKFNLSFGSCGTLNINNVVGVKLYGSEEALKSGQVMDSMELDHDMDLGGSELANKYYEMLKGAEIDQQVYFDSKFKWDGIVIRKSNDAIEIELFKHGINESLNEADSDYEWDPTDGTEKPKVKPRKKPVKQSLILTVDLTKNPFYEEGGVLKFKANAYDKQSDSREDFIIDVKTFDVSEKRGETKKPKVKQGDELVDDAKVAYDIILNDPLLKKAFYKHPSLWNLFVAEMNGKKAPGTGIVPTLQFINKFKESGIDDDLDGVFVSGKPLLVSPKNVVDILYDEGGVKKNFSLDVGKKYKIIARNYKLGDEGKVLEDGNQKYKILVKENTPLKNVFLCDVIKYVTGKDGVEDFQQRDVNIEMFVSGGYNEKKVNKEEPKN
jgi:hypothetical protein